jgi:hypothetical protein
MGSISMPDTRDKAKIEARGEWISGGNSGIHLNVLRSWRESGLLAEGKDFRLKQVWAPHTHGKQLRTILFYRRAIIGKLNAKREFSSPDRPEGKRPEHAKRMLEKWREKEQIVHGGKTLLRNSAAMRFLEISDITLRRWTDKSCPYLAGGRLTSIDVEGFDYWPISELEIVKRNRNALPTGPASAETYTADETAERTGVSKKRLRNVLFCKALGLVRVFISTRVRYEKQSERNGKNEWSRIVPQVAFSKKSVDAFAKKKPDLAVPRDRITLLAASRALKMDRVTANQWCNRGALDAERRWFLTASGPKEGWLPTKESVRLAKRAIDAEGMRRAAARLAGTYSANNATAKNATPMPSAASATKMKVADEQQKPRERFDDPEHATRDSGTHKRLDKLIDVLGQKRQKGAKVKRNGKRDERDLWIYERCFEGMEHDKIVAELSKIFATRGWAKVSTKQGVRQIGIEFAEATGRPVPPARQGA